MFDFNWFAIDGIEGDYREQKNVAKIAAACGIASAEDVMAKPQHEYDTSVLGLLAKQCNGGVEALMLVTTLLDAGIAMMDALCATITSRLAGCSTRYKTHSMRSLACSLVFMLSSMAVLLKGQSPENMTLSEDDEHLSTVVASFVRLMHSAIWQGQGSTDAAYRFFNVVAEIAHADIDSIDRILDANRQVLLEASPY